MWLRPLRQSLRISFAGSDFSSVVIRQPRKPLFFQVYLKCSNEEFTTRGPSVRVDRPWIVMPSQEKQTELADH